MRVTCFLCFVFFFYSPLRHPLPFGHFLIRPFLVRRDAGCEVTLIDSVCPFFYLTCARWKVLLTFLRQLKKKIVITVGTRRESARRLFRLPKKAPVYHKPRPCSAFFHPSPQRYATGNSPLLLADKKNIKKKERRLSLHWRAADLLTSANACRYIHLNLFRLGGDCYSAGPCERCAKIEKGRAEF